MKKQVTTIILILLCSFLVLNCFTKNTDDKDTTQTGRVPLGLGDFTVKGTVVDINNIPLSGMKLSATLLDQFSEITVITDADGDFMYTGLPTLTFDQEFTFWLFSEERTYERVMYFPIGYYNLLQGLPDNLTVPQVLENNTIVLREIDNATILTGTITNASGQSIPKSEIQLIDLTREQYTYYQGPAFEPHDTTTMNTDHSYDETTGIYLFQNCLAGGKYNLHIITVDDSIYNNIEYYPVTINKGETTTQNFTLTIK